LFFKWLFDGNSVFTKLELKFFTDDHRGIYAKNNIKVHLQTIKLYLILILISLER